MAGWAPLVGPGPGGGHGSRPPSPAPARRAADPQLGSPLARLPDELLLRVLHALGARDAWLRARLWTVCRRLSTVLSRAVWPVLDLGHEFPEAFGSSARAAALFRALRSARLKCSKLVLDTTPFDRRFVEDESVRLLVERRREVGTLPPEFWTAPQVSTSPPNPSPLATESGRARGWAPSPASPAPSRPSRQAPPPRPPLPARPPDTPRRYGWIEADVGKRPFNAYARAALAALAPLGARLADLSLDFAYEAYARPRPEEDRWDHFADALRPFPALRRLCVGPVWFAEAGRGSPDTAPLPQVKVLRLASGSIDGPTLARTFPNLEEFALLCFLRLNGSAELGPAFFEALAPLGLRRLELDCDRWGWLKLAPGSLAALAKALPGLEALLVGDWVLGGSVAPELPDLRHMRNLTELDLKEPLWPCAALADQVAAVCSLRALRALRLRFMAGPRRPPRAPPAPGPSARSRRAGRDGAQGRGGGGDGEARVRPGALPLLADLELAILRYRPPFERYRDMLLPDASCAPLLRQLGPFVAAQPALASLALRVESPGRRSPAACADESRALEGLLRGAGRLLRAYRRTGLALAAADYGEAPAVWGELTALAEACPALRTVSLGADVRGPLSPADLAPLAALQHPAPPAPPRDLELVVEEGAAGLAAARAALPRWRLRLVPQQRF
eukprot:tig00000870_g5122.t1